MVGVVGLDVTGDTGGNRSTAMEPALDSAEVGVVGRLLMLEELLLLRICLMALIAEPHDLGVLF